MPGIQPEKSEVDLLAGRTALAVRLAFEQVRRFKEWLDTKTEADLTDLGFTTNDVAVLRSSYGDLEQLRLIYEGTQNLSAAKDFRVFARRLWGLGT